MRTCTIDGCARKHKAREMCLMHYKRWYKHNAQSPEPKRFCTIDGCNKPHKGRGWCVTHYDRWQRHGDPEHQEDRNYGCGTHAGYQRHRKRGEDVCQPCRDAMNAYNRARRAKMPKTLKPVAEDIPEGTPHCAECTRPMAHRSTTKANMPDGWARRHNYAQCTACYDKARAAFKAAKKVRTEKPAIADPALEAFNRRRRERLARQQRLAQVRRTAA